MKALVDASGKVLIGSDGKVATDDCPSDCCTPLECPALLDVQCDNYAEGYGEVNGYGLGFTAWSNDYFNGPGLMDDDCCPMLHAEHTSTWDGLSCNCVWTVSSPAPFQTTWLQYNYINYGGIDGCLDPFNCSCPDGDLCLFDDCTSTTDPITGHTTTNCTGGDSGCDEYCSTPFEETYFTPAATYDVQPYVDNWRDCGSQQAYRLLDFPFCSSNHGSTHLGRVKFRLTLSNSFSGSARITWVETFTEQLTTCSNCLNCPEFAAGTTSEKCLVINSADLIDAGGGTFYIVYEVVEPDDIGAINVSEFNFECIGSC